MCGRFIIFSEAEEREIQSIVEEVNRKYGENAMKTGSDIFPTEVSPVITSERGAKSISLFKWGFPGYKGGQVIINARSESIMEKTMFREAFAAHRCLIPASAFFEWKQVDGKKKKHTVRCANSGLFYMAGIYEGFIDKNGCPFTGFVVITTSAGEKMSSIHDRMPVILTEQSDIDLWMDDQTKDYAKLQGLLRPVENILISA